ncbi:MAG TPA: hypothetical protein PL001_00005, partial [Candidatus Kryptobacter bacterium]|nr:hypothetical protein [Candidatus Kryptobacter bacterium]
MGFFQNIEDQAEEIVKGFGQLFDKLIDGTATAPTNTSGTQPEPVVMPAGTLEQQIAQLLLQIANQNASSIALLTDMRNALAPQSLGQRTFYKGSLSTTYDAGGKSYFQFQATHYHFIALNGSSTQPMYFSFDGSVDAGEILVGEYLPFNNWPA